MVVEYVDPDALEMDMQSDGDKSYRQMMNDNFEKRN
jgi:hypothetical protein